MTILTVFRSHLANSQYAFKNGKMAHFISLGDKPAEFLTSVEGEIKELLAEVHLGHPHIYVPAKAEDQTVDTEFDPMAKLKADIRAQVMAELNQVPTAGRSVTGNAPVLGGMANSSTIQGATAENVRPVPVIPTPVIPVKSETTVEDTGSDVATGSDTATKLPTDPALQSQSDTAAKLSMTDKLAALKAGKSAGE
jgi:hypothetical protein